LQPVDPLTRPLLPGPCDKLHDEGLQKKYQESKDKGRLGYEEEFVATSSRIINQLEIKCAASFFFFLPNHADTRTARIRQGYEKLARQQLENKVPNTAKIEFEQKLARLDTRISETLESVEKAGEEGQVDEAKKLNQQLEALQAEKEALRIVTHSKKEK